MLVADDEVRIVPEDASAYPPDFVLATARSVARWRTPVRSDDFRAAVWLRAYLATIHGRDGRWLLLGDPPVQAAFRPDSWRTAAAQLESSSVVMREATAGEDLPEPDGFLVLAGIFITLLPVLFMLPIVSAAWDLHSPAGRALGCLILLTGLLLAYAVNRLWDHGVLVASSQAQRRSRLVPPLPRHRRAGDDERQPGLRTVAIAGVLGLLTGSVAGVVITLSESPRVSPLTAGLWFGLLVGVISLVCTGVWVVLVRLERRGTQPVAPPSPQPLPLIAPTAPRPIAEPRHHGAIVSQRAP
jgi:hypothetical protein